MINLIPYFRWINWFFEYVPLLSLTLPLMGMAFGDDDDDDNLIDIDLSEDIQAPGVDLTIGDADDRTFDIDISALPDTGLDLGDDISPLLDVGAADLPDASDFAGGSPNISGLGSDTALDALLDDYISGGSALIEMDDATYKQAIAESSDALIGDFIGADNAVEQADFGTGGTTNPPDPSLFQQTLSALGFGSKEGEEEASLKAKAEAIRIGRESDLSNARDLLNEGKLTQTEYLSQVSSIKSSAASDMALLEAIDKMPDGETNAIFEAIESVPSVVWTLFGLWYSAEQNKRTAEAQKEFTLQTLEDRQAHDLAMLNAQTDAEIRVRTKQAELDDTSGPAVSSRPSASGGRRR